MEKSSQKRIHWLRLWTKGWLEGSIRFDLTPAQRSVFIDLCALARQSRNPPMVQANETVAYPHTWLANKLNISLELLEETLELCAEQERISENSNGIKVIKFEYYQGPVEGREPYRERKKQRTPEESAEINKQNTYKARLKEEIGKYRREHGTYAIGDDLEAINTRLQAEIYGEEPEPELQEEAQNDTAK